MFAKEYGYQLYSIVEVAVFVKFQVEFQLDFSNLW